jgi:predicted nucleic acid-binding protein
MSIPHPKAETRRNSKPDSSHCSRCRREAPTRGRFTATIAGIKKFLCRVCCAEIGSVAALIANAEASERELERQRFTERRPADRREAA